MQRKPDIVLDEGIWQEHHWLIRSRHHARVGIDPEAITVGSSDKPEKLQKGFQQFAKCCGEALALAHARGDRRSCRFEKAMAKTLKQEMPSH